MKIAAEFKEFVLRGNVVDLAVGVVIGAAFGKIVTSLVSDILMPPIGMLLGNADFSYLAVVLSKSTDPDVPDVALRYGAFINSVIDFLIIAAAIFVVVKIVNQMMRRSQRNTVPTAKDCPMCCTSIPIAAKKCGHCCSPL